MIRRSMLFLAGAALLCADPLTQGERDRAMSHLHATRKQVLDAVAGLSEAQWKWKPAPDRWSVAECVEHIAVSEDGLMQMVRKTLQGPAAPEKKAQAAGLDEKVMQMIPDRSQKVQAPETLRPTGRWPDREALLAEFKTRRDRSIEFVEKTPEDLRGHFAPSPLKVDLDAYQWMLFIAAHTDRHIQQLLEVKADPGFPKQ